MDAGTLIASVFGSLGGGWLGATLAVRKLRAEKAFERQLQWHEDMADLLYRLASALNVATSLSGRHYPQAQRDLSIQVDRLAIDGQKADLYASDVSRAKIAALMSLMRDAMIPHMAHDEPQHDAMIAELRSLVKPVRETASVLAEDVRSQLGIGGRRIRVVTRTWGK